MAFAVTKFLSYGLEIPDPVPRRCVQRVEMTVTSLAADVAWDIGASAGTFWSAAVADVTYGGIATQALAALKLIGANALVFDRIGGTILNSDYQPGPLATGSVYTFSIGTNGCPTITFDVACGPGGTVYLIMEWEMNEGVAPLTANLG
jgi:hypothetical protein